MPIAQALTSSTADWTRWIPVVSVIIAMLALLATLSNRNTARRALALSTQQEERRVARLTVSLHDAASWRSPGASRWVGLKILAVNPTDRDGALVNADLHIAYTLPTGHAMTVKLRHEAGGEEFPPGIEALELPERLQANGAMGGWLMFRLPAGLLPDRAGVERYDMLLQDSRGITETVSAFILREVSHEQTPEQ